MGADVSGLPRDPLLRPLLDLIDFIERRGRVCMVVGAMAVAVWGRPRGTADLDIAVHADARELDVLATSLATLGFTIDTEWLDWNPLLRGQHVRLRSQATIVDLMRPRDEHDAAAFARRRHVDVEGRRVPFVSPEDLILMKLKAGRPRDFEDAVSVIEAQRARLDLDYLDDGAARLGLSPELGWVLGDAPDSTP